MNQMFFPRHEMVQELDSPRELSRQTSLEQTQGPMMELDDSLDILWSSLKPTMQAVLAKFQLRPNVVLSANPKLYKSVATLE